MPSRAHVPHALLAALAVFVVHSLTPLSRANPDRSPVPVMQRWLGAGAPAGGIGEDRAPIATPALTLPLFWIFDRLAPYTPPIDPGHELLAKRRYSQVHRTVEIRLASAWIALAALFLFLSIPGPPAQAWFWTMTFAFGTGAWSSASRALTPHPVAIALVAAALFFLTRKPRRPALAGALLGLAAWNCPETLLALPCLALWLRRETLPLLAGAAAASVPFAVYHLVQFTPPALLPALTAPSRRALSIFYSPCLLLLPLGAARLWRKDRRLVLALSAWFLLHLAAMTFTDTRAWSTFLPAAFLGLSPLWPPRPWIALPAALSVTIQIALSCFPHWFV